jgi:hypothetical protein
MKRHEGLRRQRSGGSDQSQPGKQFMRPKTHHKNRAGGMAQGVRPEFKPQCRKKTPKNNKKNPIKPHEGNVSAYHGVREAHLKRLLYTARFQLYDIPEKVIGTKKSQL